MQRGMINIMSMQDIVHVSTLAIYLRLCLKRARSIMCWDDADNVALRPARICRSATLTATYEHILDMAHHNMLVNTLRTGHLNC